MTCVPGSPNASAGAQANPDDDGWTRALEQARAWLAQAEQGE
jgi:hypothetical protein